MMSLPFGLFTQVSGSGPLGPLVLSLEIFYSSVPLLQRCIADSVCVSVTIFFSCIPIMAMLGIGSCFSNTVHSGEFLRPIY